MAFPAILKMSDEQSKLHNRIITIGILCSIGLTFVNCKEKIVHLYEWMHNFKRINKLRLAL